MGLLSAITPGVGSLLGSVGGALVGGVTSFLGQKSANNTNIKLSRENNAFNAAEAEKARKFNSQEAALAREFNSAEAEKQRAYNTSMYEKSLSWRSPANQLKLMQEAGLNPLNFQQGSVSDSAPSSSAAIGPSASGPSASSVGLPQVRNPVDASAFSQIASALSDVKLKEAQANQANAATLTENLMRDGKVELQNSQISLNVANASLTKAQEAKVGKELVKLDTEVQHLQASIDNLKANTGYTQEMERYQSLKSEEQQKVNAQLEKRLAAELRQIKAAADLSEAQRVQVLEMAKGIAIENFFKPTSLYFQIQGQKASISLTDAQRLSFDLQNTRPAGWTQIKSYLNAGNDIMSVLGQLIDKYNDSVTSSAKIIDSIVPF